jgi:hypothetical protein
MGYPGKEASMNIMSRSGFALAISTLLICACARSSDCPAQKDVEASIRKDLETNVWSETERYIWKIKALSDFAFGPIESGHVIKKQVEYGRDAQDVCPVRVEYTYKLVHADGHADSKSEGANKTYLFYRNGFDEWVFKTE